LGSVKSAFKNAGFNKTFAFYENVQFGSVDINTVKNIFLEEPIIKEAGNSEMIAKSVEKELKALFFKEEIPLAAEFLIIVAYKL
jgi:hypothetical protein